MKLQELAEKLLVIDTRLTEASDEIIAKIDELKSALDNVPIPDDAVELIDTISQKAATLADIVPNE